MLAIESILALLLALYLLYKYSDIRRQNPFVTVCTLAVWSLSFVIIFFLPVDVSSVSSVLGVLCSTKIIMVVQCNLILTM